MTTQLKAIRLCLRRRYRRRLCCRFRVKILKIRRLKILPLLAPFAAWPWSPWRCNKLSTPCQRVRRVGSAPAPPISPTRKRRFQHRPSSTALSIGWRSTSGRTGRCLGTRWSASGFTTWRQRTRRQRRRRGTV